MQEHITFLYRAVLNDHYGLCKEQGEKEVVKEDYLPNNSILCSVPVRELLNNVIKN